MLRPVLACSSVRSSPFSQSRVSASSKAAASLRRTSVTARASWRLPHLSSTSYNGVRALHDFTQAPSWNDYRRDKHSDPKTRKAFSYLMVGLSSATGLAGVKSTVFHAVNQWNASADVMAMANVEVDLATIPEGSAVTIMWRGKPLFVRHRTAAEIAAAEDVDLGSLRDPEPDAKRRNKPEWLVVIGICTHLGCVPINGTGEYKGYFCPCHGSHYDTSGRIRKGPAPRNLEVPPHKFLDESHILVGVSE